ncbi:PAS domain-containing protein [Dongia sp.]|uniref:PAS domain-containing protein n=1 Tax=Dongia sp. TaxID=1977262 RepID=UPI003752988B
MGATSAGAAQVEAGKPEAAKPGQPGAIRLDGHFGRGRRAAAPQLDAMQLRLDDPDLDADLKFALDYWFRKRAGRLAPSRADIDPVEIAPLLPRVMLVDVSLDPVDFRFRLAGTGLFKIHGAELTNKRALDLEPPAYGALIHRLYCDALSGRAPMAHRLLIECETRRSAFLRIILPLSEDGATINRLLTVESYADAAQDLRDCFEEARLSASRS